MVFSSVTFLFFFLPLTVSIFLLLRNRKVLRNVFLLIVSLLFYLWGEKIYTLLMVFSITANYFFGLWMSRTKDRKKLVVTLAIIFNLIPLFFFKYMNFFVDNLNTIISVFGLEINIGQIHLPIGISFFTFQIMSYVIDLYRGKIEVQKNPISLGLYISLFPQLIAGPIVRYFDIAKQLVERRVTFEDFSYGVKRFIVGLGKKVLIANIVAMPADKIFGMPGSELTFDVAWLGIICYTLQLYFDFSGYSDMAIGLGRMFGFKFLENFNYPYICKSLKDFWARWHISLTTWFRDYLYFSLGGNQVSERRVYVNLVTVFILTGLWHGANWTFFVFGIWHGIFLILERKLPKDFMESKPRIISNTYAVLVVMISLVLFRSETLTFAIDFVWAMIGFSSVKGEAIYSARLFMNSELLVAIILGVVGSTPIIPYINKKYEEFASKREGAGAVLYDIMFAGITVISLVTIFLLSSMSLASDTYNPFIYFRF